MKSLIFLVLTSFIISCTVEPTKLATNECEQLDSEEKRYRCYFLDLKYYINSQIESDIKTWLYMNEPFRRNVVAEPKVGIELNTHGEVKNLVLLQTSGDITFDNMLLQSIKNASPFNLPKEEKIKARLTKFTWVIRI